MAYPRMYRIKVVPAVGAPYCVKCNTDEFTVGSAPDKDLVLTGAGIEAYHLQIKFDNSVKVRSVERPEWYNWPKYEYTALYRPLEFKDYILSLEEEPSTQLSIRPQAAQLGSRTRPIIQAQSSNSRWFQSHAQRRILFVGLLLLGLGGFWWVFQTEDEDPVIAQKLLPTNTPTWTATATMAPTQPPTPTSTPRPTNTSVAAVLPPTATSTLTPTATATPYPDTRETIYSLPAELQVYGGWVETATVPIGQPYWKLVGVQWLVGDEAKGQSSIFVEVLNPNSQRDINQQVVLLDSANQPQVTKFTADKPGGDYACDFPMFNAGPSYGVKVAGVLPSETLHGLGRGLHNDATVITSFKLIFKQTNRDR